MVIRQLQPVIRPSVYTVSAVDNKYQMAGFSTGMTPVAERC